MTRAACALSAMLCGFLACGCEPSARPLAWRLRLADASLAPRIAAVEVWIAIGSCGGDKVHSELVRTGEPFTAPPGLEPGLYGFGARAYDEMCAPVAQGCATIGLPLASESILEVELAPATSSAACPMSECFAGICAVADAGLDAGPAVDAGEPCDPVAQTGCMDGLACYLMQRSNVFYCATPGRTSDGYYCRVSDDCMPGSYCPGIAACAAMCKIADPVCGSGSCTPVMGGPADVGVCQ